jgi:hypothetical protein
MQVNIKVSVDRLDINALTVDELMAIEGDAESTKALRNLVSRFVTDDKGEYLSEHAARKAIGGLTRPQVIEVMQSFGQQLRDALVPPENAAS